MTQEKVRVLLIEDDPGDVGLVKQYLFESNGASKDLEFELKHQTSLSQGIKAASSGDADVVLLDLTLPDSEGSNTYSMLANSAPNMPIVILSNFKDEHLADNVVRRGAQDYLMKCDLNAPLLHRAIHYAINRKQAERALREAKREVETRGWGLQKTNESIRLLYKELEKKNLKLQGVDQLKSEFVSTVSHELRTPMTIIREGVSQVLDGLLGPTTDDQKQFLQIALEGIDRLSRIINDLLDFSKLEAGRVELDRDSINFVAVCKRVLKDFETKSKEKGLALKIECTREEMPLYADGDKMIQVLTNLLGNAMKFTEQGSITVRVTDSEKELKCIVSDTGPGIPEDDLGRLFGQFEQVGRVAGPGDKGTGLGLAISKGIVELHNGKIGVESTLDVGTQFTFTLPKVTAEELLREYVAAGIREAIRQEAALAVVIVSIRNFETVKKEKGEKNAALLLQNMATVLRKSLRRKGDKAMASHNSILLILPATSKEDGLMVGGRMRQILDDYLAKKGMTKEVIITTRVAAFPDDGNTAEEILKRAFS